MSTAQRSKTGCWTCRLRRKKCNEGGPPCANCESRGVFCHGYGPKPPWKDRGEKEKEQASRLRLQPRQRRSRSKNLSGGMPQQCSARSASIDNSDCNVDTTAPGIRSPSQSDLSSLSSFQDPQAFELLENLDLFGPWNPPESSNNDFWLSSRSAEALVGCNDVQPPREDLRPASWDVPDSSNELLLSSGSAEAFVGFDDAQPPEGSQRSDRLDDAIGFSSDSWPGRNSAEALDTLAAFQPPTRDRRLAPLNNANDLRPSPSSAETLNSVADLQPPARDPPPRLAICLPSVAAARVSDIDEREIELVMHFIGETFALQHTSYRASSTVQRSWLLLLLMRSPTFYYASLSMSAYHSYLNLSGDSEVRASTFEAYQKYRTCALTGFYELLKSDHLSASSSGSVPGECMICGVQIALLEVKIPNELFRRFVRRSLSNDC